MGGVVNAQRPVWLTAPVLTVSVLSVAAGVGQFAVTTVIGTVAADFGEPTVGDEAIAQIGLPVTTLGIALSVIRLASLLSLPLAAQADRFGRRSVLLTMAAVGLALSAVSALAPTFWFYVALVALARPALSAVNALAGVVAAEEAPAKGRSAALALIAAAYGLGAGIVAVGRGLLPGEPDWRPVMAFALIPLLLLPLLARTIREPRIASDHISKDRTGPVGLPGRVPRRYLRRVVLFATLTGSLTLATGPGFTLFFVYGEQILDASPLFLSMLVLGAGPTGLLGILAGRWAADNVGRTRTAAISMAATGVAIALMYAGDIALLSVGYLLALATSSAFAPPTGALVAELVPTRIRATVAGWGTVAAVVGAAIGLVAFGVIADMTGEFRTAALLVGAIVVVVSFGFRYLPETLGTELEEVEDADRSDSA